MGNVLRSDDGVGVHAVNLLLDSGRLPDWVEAVDAGASGLDLPAMVSGRERILVIDALTTNAPPGSVFRFPASNLTRTTDGMFSVHETGICDALAAARLLGERPQAEILGIVPADAETMNPEPTQAVRAVLPRVVAMVRTIISEYQESTGTLRTGGETSTT
jgi:hydrogenase maturation protease